MQHLKLLKCSQLEAKVLSIFVKLPSHRCCTWIYYETIKKNSIHKTTKESISIQYFMLHKCSMFNAQKGKSQLRIGSFKMELRKNSRRNPICNRDLEKFFFVMLSATGHRASFNLVQLKILSFFQQKLSIWLFWNEEKKSFVSTKVARNWHKNLWKLKFAFSSWKSKVNLHDWIITMEIWWMSNGELRMLHLIFH